jgi:hypothetical protein
LRTTVQPGDDLLLLNSSYFRNQFAQVDADSEKQEVARCCAALRWVRSLLQGKEASPSCFSHKMDLLEPLRALCLGDASAAIFGDIGVKHIQVCYFGCDTCE